MKIWIAALLQILNYFFSVCGCGVMKLKVCWVFAKCKLQSCIISRKWTIERWDVLFSRKGVRGTFNHCLVKVTPYRFLYICLASEKKGALKELSSPFCQISRQWFLSHEQNPWLRIGSSRIWGSCYFINNGNLQFKFKQYRLFPTTKILIIGGISIQLLMAKKLKSWGH